MFPHLPQLILTGSLLWCAAICWKAAGALRSGTPYTFSMWDGGLVFQGKHLSTTGTKAKFGTAAVVAGTRGLALLGLVPLRTASLFLCGVIALMIVLDLVLRSRGESSRR